MKSFIVYAPTGRIIRTGTCCAETLKAQASRDGEESIAGLANDSTDYIKNGKVTKRPLFDVTVDGLTVSGIPTSTEVYIDGGLAGQCDTDNITIEKENPIDSVTVRLSLFPFIDKEITL